VLRKRRALEEKEYNKIEILSLFAAAKDDIKALIGRIRAAPPEKASLVLVVEKKRALLAVYVEVLRPILEDYKEHIDDEIMRLLDNSAYDN